MGTPHRLTSGLLAISAALAGCSVNRSGVDRSDVGPTAETAPTQPSTTGPDFSDVLPPRSRELDLTGVDPCKDLFTVDQLRELRYDLGYARPPRPDHSDIHGGADCTYSSTGGAGGSSRNMRALVGISTSEGAQAWLTPDRSVTTRPEVVTIAGFAALVLPHPDFSDDCLLVVDTAEGQYLEVTVSAAIGEPPNRAPYCAEAERLARMAIENVSKLR